MLSKSDLLTFSETYHYPAIINDILSEIQAILQSRCRNIISAILVGSTARGEFSYRQESNGGYTFWSDIELFIVADKEPSRTDREQLSTVFNTLEQKWEHNSPLFHIDYSYLSRKKFHHLAPVFRHYEAKQVGKVIFGQDIRSEMPEINCDNLDYRELAEVILWRLWAMALFVPQSWLIANQRNGESANRRREKKNEDLFRFVLCRNALDLTTYLLPWEKVLLPSFNERTNYIVQHYADLRLRELFDISFLEYLNTCLRGKFEFIFPESAEKLYQQTLLYFIQAGKHILSLSQIKASDEDFIDNLVIHQAQLFNEYRPRRKVYELYLIKKHFTEKSLVSWCRWYLQGKIGKMVGCLFHLHLALQSHLRLEQSRANQHLDSAWRILDQITLRKLPQWDELKLLPFSEQWRSARFQFARFLMDVYQSVGAKADYLNKILEKQ